MEGSDLMKRFMLDSNVWFEDADAGRKITRDGNELYVSSTVIEELDKHKGDFGIAGYNVRKSIRWIEENEESYEFIIDREAVKEPRLDISINDNMIIESARANNCIIISNDTNVRLKAKKIGLEAEKWKSVKKNRTWRIKRWCAQYAR